MFAGRALAGMVLLVGAFGDEPFGRETLPALEGDLTVRWRAVQSDIAIELSVIRLCRAEPAHCPSRVAPRFLAIVDEGAAETGRLRLGVINRGINLAMRPVSSVQAHGVPEYWAAPLAALESGGGECADYAIAKYVALIEAGVAVDDVRIVFVIDRDRGDRHAVTAARDDGGWLILDDRTMALVEDIAAGSYAPILSIDHRGVRTYAWVPVASASRPCVKLPA
jgi:predicted transglutaminase-like cysteine proteinase